MSTENNKTAVIEGRLDMRDLATCADYLVHEGIAPQSKSDLLFKVVATFAQSAITHHGIRRYESTSDALEQLQTLGLGVMNRAKGGRMANAFTLGKVIAQERQTVQASDKEPSVADFIDMMKSGKVRMPS